jgi:hypothetical protein
MTDRDQKRMQARQKDDATKNVLDHELDAALTKYAAVEPRAGLEERVLANLRAEQSGVPVRAWWRWSVAVAVLIVVVALSWRWERPSHPVVAVRPANPTQASQQRKQFVSNGVRSGVRRRTSNPARKKIRSASPVVVAAGPKLDQFPSPQPLTEQELALARYVRDFPQEAALIARAQEEYEKGVEQKMRDAGSQLNNSESEQQER